ncbi:MAG TPA: serine hydrolase [Burkholderiaceae bacterium]|nr:serine hydrolase [Burkholderiaceae bacterium]
MKSVRFAALLSNLPVSLAMLGALAFLPAPASAEPDELMQAPAQLDAPAPLGMQPVPRPVSYARSVDRAPKIKSEFALVVDQDTNEILMQKNPEEVSSIASITKLMTAIVTLDAGLPLDEELQVQREDRTSVGWTGSSLRPGVRLTRGQALHLALMSSENHAAQLLGRTYPGGVAAMVEAMNAKARELGMNDSNFADPTGLSPDNRSSPNDLVLMVKAAYGFAQIREFSVSTAYDIRMGKRLVRYQNTNRLTSHTDWQIGLQKTGYINAAGRCLVMQAVIEGRRVVMVLLDSMGRYSRFADAQRIHDWLVARASADRSLALE